MSGEMSRLSVPARQYTDNRDDYTSNEEFNLRIVRRWEAQGVLCPLCRTFQIFREWGHCTSCHPAVVQQDRRAAAREARLAAAPPCAACGGPLWPDGVPVGRVRSDRKTCSDRCRQTLRRRAS